ncbi:transglutaminase domain-containing protein [Pyrococcus horikoshii]|uniref:Transglutaminase-like domain-containing protein n=2 Tax=Pyrococcus horikoshii TaxID=53953 RepID=O58213_PYRHO|nr:transglutaminase domain-containing protein [Pyrococcus horikoshii]BAA29548.1 530aa long hypothetical protein [Pyrococcus horikoshii OT3]HII60954.1 hypothetical protein [Pyrococcus horikoshii]
MKHLKLIVVILATLALGCLIKSPASVKFEIDRTTIPPSGVFHLIVTLNNTGKVGIVDAKLVVEGEEFFIVQSPKLEHPIKVGDSAKLIWTIKGPKIPGNYHFKAYLDIVDELNRVWRGITYETTIKVSSEELKDSVNLNLTVPSKVQGGKIIIVSGEIVNNLTVPVNIVSAEVSAEDLEVIDKEVPNKIDANSKGKVVFKFKVPPRYEKVRMYVIIEYASLQVSGKLIGEKDILIVWKPWELSPEDVKDIYGNLSEWIFYNDIVDGYWEWMYGSKSKIENRTMFRESVEDLLSVANSDVEAAKAVYNHIVTNYVIEKRRIKTLDPQKIMESSSISPTEAEILMVAYLRSLNIPARIVSVYSETDCTYSPFVEAYLSGKWYVIDFNHMFFGTREEFIATRWYPKIYQEITVFGKSLVALKPSPSGHAHEDLTKEYLSITEKALFNHLSKSLDPSTFSQVRIMLNSMNNEDERIFAMFLFTSAKPEEAKQLLEKVHVNELKKTIDAFYKFYRDIPWEEDFRIYWEKLINLYR